MAWLLLTFLPLDREETARQEPVATETIAEAQPQQSATMIEVPSGAADQTFEITTTTAEAPPLAPTDTVNPPMTSASRAPVLPVPAPATPRAPVPRPPVIVDETPRPQPQPQPAPRPQPVPSSSITESEAASVLRSYVRSTRYYQVAGECVRVEPRGYRNAGYNLEVWHSCAGGGTSRLLGRWRVDAKTREVFVQRDDGRYLRP